MTFDPGNINSKLIQLGTLLDAIEDESARTAQDIIIAAMQELKLMQDYVAKQSDLVLEAQQDRDKATDKMNKYLGMIQQAETRLNDNALMEELKQANVALDDLREQNKILKVDILAAKKELNDIRERDEDTPLQPSFITQYPLMCPITTFKDAFFIEKNIITNKVTKTQYEIDFTASGDPRPYITILGSSNTFKPLTNRPRGRPRKYT